jgi:hypothetical protein
MKQLVYLNYDQVMQAVAFAMSQLFQHTVLCIGYLMSLQCSDECIGM